MRVARHGRLPRTGNGFTSGVPAEPWPGIPVTVSGTGMDEIAALRDLDDRLRGREDSGGQLDALR